MSDNKITEEGFRSFLALFRGYGYLQLTVNGKKVDHDTFVELVAEHDPKLAERMNRYLTAARDLRNYIEQVYVGPAEQAPPEEPKREAN